MKTIAGEEARARLTESAAESMRAAIEETGGREVFFAGTLKPDGLVHSARVCARGHGAAVPAVFENLGTRDVVLHNHPGGNLEPSDADLELAAVYSHNGHGVYIVDNDVQRVYVVVEPFLDKDVHYLDEAELEHAMRPDSAVARVLPGYEVRPQQSRMMEAVTKAFNEESVAVVEAPTGVGKTLAYLLPAVTWSVRNRERVVITTRTINLQEQIVFKDIPLLQKALNETFSAVLVKGRQNYLCPRRLERALSEVTLFQDERHRQTLSAIAEWAEHTEDGSTSDLPFVPPREVWERVCSEADTCTTAQCQSSRKPCFVMKARREIAKADVLVVNHHMLFSDLAIKRELGNFNSIAVLPAYRRVIFDEAHHIEDAATEYFGVSATRNGAMALLGRFYRQERAHERGLIPFIKIRLMQDAPSLSHPEFEQIQDLIENGVMPSWSAAREALDTAFQSLRSLAAERCGQLGRDIKWRLTQEALNDPELRELHKVYVLPAAEETSTLAKHCTALLTKLQGLRAEAGQDEKPLSMETAQLQSYRDRLLRLASVLAECTSPELEENTVRWIEIDSNNKSIIRVARCPLEVGKPLSEWVYPNLKTCVMTSATLSVQRKFEFLARRIGLDETSGKEVDYLILDSPFDFERQALLCIAKDMAPPDNSRFMETSTEFIGEALKITGGHAFVLFTSFYALDFAHKRLENSLRQAGIVALKQGSASRTHLLDRFRNDASSCLFGTDSFWEGVDVAGEALQCVILPRLPFRVPSEPILQARAEAIEAAGGRPFMEYTVPMAVIKMRQGFGRLIRRKSDRGAILLLDSRVLSKHYGKMFLESLPNMRVVADSREEVAEELRRFFSNEEKLPR